MSRKHNTKHPERSASRYAERLAKRGLRKAPMLDEIEGSQGLRSRQERRKDQTGSPFVSRASDELEQEDAA